MNYLNNMVLEANTFFLLAASVLDVEDADEVSSPATDQAVEYLENDAGDHSQLGEGVGECKQHLRNLERERERENLD